MWIGYQQLLQLHIGCILINIWTTFITTNNRGVIFWMDNVLIQLLYQSTTFKIFFFVNSSTANSINIQKSYRLENQELIMVSGDGRATIFGTLVSSPKNKKEGPSQ